MTEAREIIYYIKSLKKGFNKDLFQSKIDNLAYIVDSVGLDYVEFHTLFQVWLNLSIPITKWVNLGSCLVPQEKVERKTIEYALAWLLSNHGNQNAFPRIAFLLDWLTAALDCECVDINDLDIGYELFYTMLSYEVLTLHVLKLIYTLTKPVDVTRENVIELLHCAKQREAKKSMHRQLQVLLGLFKSYRPECVPEDVPAISVHTSFKKINVNLLERFKRIQDRRNKAKQHRQYLLWINPLNGQRRNKNVVSLVPNIEFTNAGVKRNADREPKKNYLDFSDPITLLQYSMKRPMARPDKLRALLCNETGMALLAVTDDAEQAFLAHNLQHLLTSAFLETSPYSYEEKSDLLQRLATLQRTILQGVPTITRFLAQYLPFWNENEYFAEILELVEWLSPDSTEHISLILDSLSRIYCRAQPIEQCAIMNALTNMYCNMIYSSTRTRLYFMETKLSTVDYDVLLQYIAKTVNELCESGLQINPDDIRTSYTIGRHIQTSSLCQTKHGTVVGVMPGLLSLLAPLVAPSSALMEQMAGILMLQKKLRSIAKSKNIICNEEVLKGYLHDMINCLFKEEALSSRQSGLLFKQMNPQIVDKVQCLLPGADAAWSIRNSLAFAPYTYVQLGYIDHEDATNKLWFEAVIEQEFNMLSKFLKTTISALRT